MRNRLRRRDQKSGGSSDKFMEIIEELVKISKMPENTNYEKNCKRQKIFKLQQGECLDLNKDESTQDWVENLYCIIGKRPFRN